MEPRSATAIEAAVRIRSGKKWKKRYCVLQRLSPTASDAALLYIYKNVKCSLKSARKKRIVQFEGFYGLESGFILDKEQHTLAVICHSCMVVIAFETDYALRSWELWLRDLFGCSCQYSVLALELPSNFARFKNVNLRLHLRDKRFCLVRQSPPSLVVELLFRDLRRFGPTPDNNFVVEAGTRAGTYAGVYVFRSDNMDQIVWAFQMAREARLNDYISNRDDYENVAVDGRDEQTTLTSLSGIPTRYMTTPSASRRFQSSSIGERFVESFLPKNPAVDQLAPTRCEPAWRQPVKSSRSPNVCVGNTGKAAGAVLLPDGTVRHHRNVKTEFCPSDHDALLAVWADYKNRSGQSDVGPSFVTPRRHRPKSICEPASSSSRKPFEAVPTGRPLSEIYPTAVSQNDGGQVMVPLPVPSSSCARCRNYVNQPFIDSLQYYYNIDHVVLALSKKSKCCDHVCAAKKHVDEQRVEENNKILLAPAAKASGGKLGDESISVNIPSTDYAAMAPRGGLYVLMEPGPKSPTRQSNVASPSAAIRALMNVQRRHSEVSVPPDDPLHVDESNVVTVPSGGASNVAVARSGIIVKPFEPLFLIDRRGSGGKPASSICRGCTSVERKEERSLPASMPLSTPEKALVERSASRGRRNVYGAPISGPSQYSSYRVPKSEERGQAMALTNTAGSNVWRSASFAARDALRSSSRRTRTFFGALARRASSAVFRRGNESCNSVGDGSSDSRESRARSEPPIAGMDDNRSPWSLERRYLNDLRKWQNSVDLDEVIYEGTSFSSSNARTDVYSKMHSMTNCVAQKASKRGLAPQRSLGTESTWSSDSNAHRVPRRLSGLRGVDVSGVFDSMSLVSEMSDSDVFVNETWHAGRDAAARDDYPVSTAADTVGNRDKTSHTSFLDGNAIVEIRPKGMNESTRRRVKEAILAGSFSGYDGDRSSDSHQAYSCTSAAAARKATNAVDDLWKKISVDWERDVRLPPPPSVVRRRIEKRTAAYSPPPPFDHALSPVTAQSDGAVVKKPASKRHARALPPPSVEGEFFKFPPYPITIDDDCADSTLLNYATLATQDALTPTSAGGANRISVRRSVNDSSTVEAKPVEYAKIDELATQAARKAITSRHDESRTLSDGEQSVDTTRSVPCPRSSVKGRRAFALKKSLLRRRLSVASLSGV